MPLFCADRQAGAADRHHRHRGLGLQRLAGVEAAQRRRQLRGDGLHDREGRPEDQGGTRSEVGKTSSGFPHGTTCTQPLCFPLCLQEWFTVYEHNRRAGCTVSDLIMGNEYSFRVFSENICGRSDEAGVSKNTAVIGKTGDETSTPLKIKCSWSWQVVRAVRTHRELVLEVL